MTPNHACCGEARCRRKQPILIRQGAFSEGWYAITRWRQVEKNGKRLIFRELKSDKGQLRPEQQEWLDALAFAGQDVGVWRPVDLRSGRIKAELEAIR